MSVISTVTDTVIRTVSIGAGHRIRPGTTDQGLDRTECRAVERARARAGA